MSHIVEHCDTPNKIRKWPIGMLWARECGQVWRLMEIHGMITIREWEKFSIGKTK